MVSRVQVGSKAMWDPPAENPPPDHALPRPASFPGQALQQQNKQANLEDMLNVTATHWPTD